MGDPCSLDRALGRLLYLDVCPQIPGDWLVTTEIILDLRAYLSEVVMERPHVACQTRNISVRDLIVGSASSIGRRHALRRPSHRLVVWM